MLLQSWAWTWSHHLGDMGSCGISEPQQENNLKYSPKHVLSCHPSPFSSSSPSNRWFVLSGVPEPLFLSPFRFVRRGWQDTPALQQLLKTQFLRFYCTFSSKCRRCLLLHSPFLAHPCPSTPPMPAEQLLQEFVSSKASIPRSMAVSGDICQPTRPSRLCPGPAGSWGVAGDKVSANLASPHQPVQKPRSQRATLNVTLER